MIENDVERYSKSIVEAEARAKFELELVMRKNGEK